MGFLDLLFGKDYMPLSDRQMHDLHELTWIDGVAYSSHFRELSPGTGVHKVHFSYRDSYQCVIGGDEFQTFRKSGAEADWLEGRLRYIFSKR